MIALLWAVKCLTKMFKFGGQGNAVMTWCAFAKEGQAQNELNTKLGIWWSNS